MNKKITASLPAKPGVYLFKNTPGAVIYVGKAVNLKNRVRSYIQKEVALGPKTRSMVGQIATIDHIVVESEIEALLLEAALIKKYLPRYNTQGKDDKHPLYIQITKEEFPKVMTVRKAEIKPKAVVFGPFPSSQTVRGVLKTLRHIFPYCSCTKMKSKPCLYVHLGLCAKGDKEKYLQNISYLKAFLAGKKPGLIKKMTGRMKREVKKQNFEEAAKIRDQILQLEYITQPNRNTSEYLSNPNLILDRKNEELSAIASFIKENFGKQVWPKRIEAYDISNILGKQASGSMVTFVDGQEEKSAYRKFRIRFKNTPDDPLMLKETLRRRLKHQEWAYPDLILMDGGKGQVSAGQEVLREFALEIPLIGLAKREEKVVLWNEKEKRFQILSLDESPALKLFMRIRNEAHRFALSYHRLLRSRKALEWRR